MKEIRVVVDEIMPRSGAFDRYRPNTSYGLELFHFVFFAPHLFSILVLLANRLHYFYRNSQETICISKSINEGRLKNGERNGLKMSDLKTIFFNTNEL
jgi:hypothetical protein